MSEFSSCPSEKMLIDFASQSLNGDDHTTVSLHLEECQPCCEAVEWIKCHLLRPIDDDESDLTGIGLHSPGEEPISDVHSDDPNAQVVDFDFAILEKSIVDGAIGRLGKYDLLGIIGKGGMGIVFKAWDERLRRTVAIKVLKKGLATSATSRRRFLREARAAAAISHPNVVTIHSVDEHRGIPFLVMEYINGHSLRAAIRNGSRLEFSTVLRLSAQIASGLAAAHKQGVIHRDVKPGNIMLEETVDRAKITDFGLARARVDTGDQSSCELAIGTPAYMSPEQICGEAVDYRSDLFGLGCLYYEMVAGRSPFQGKNALEIARKVDSFTPQPLHVTHPHIPRFFSDVVTQLLEKDPEERFQSADRVADLLTRELHDINQSPSEQLATPFPKGTDREPTHRFRIPTWAVATPVILVVLVLIAVFIKPLRLIQEKQAVGKEAAQKAVTTFPFSNFRPSRNDLLRVSRTDPTAFPSIAHALRSLTGPATIQILDDQYYDEPICIDDPRWSGLTIDSPMAATLRCDGTETLLTINSVTAVTIRGLRLEPHSKQHAVEVKGICAGMTLNNLTIESPASSHKAAIYFNEAASGTADDPIVVSRCQVKANGCVTVFGHYSEPCQWIRLIDNRFQGHGLIRDGFGIVVHANVRELTAEDNRFFDLRRAISLASGEGRRLECLRAVNNVIYRCQDWIAVQDAQLEASEIAITGNIIAEVKGFQLSAAALKSQWKNWINANIWETTDTGIEEQCRTTSVAKACQRIAFVSRDPADQGFLKCNRAEAFEADLPPQH